MIWEVGITCCASVLLRAAAEAATESTGAAEVLSLELRTEAPPRVACRFHQRGVDCS